MCIIPREFAKFAQFANIFPMNILEVQHVSKSYTAHQALDDVSLAIPRGCVYGLLGPNGAGKTTLIRIINRITAPDSGTVLFDGRPLEPRDIYRIGYLPEERGLYRKMKVGDQAIYLAQLKGLSRREASVRLKEWFKRFEIREWWDKKVEELSKGMAQKVQFIVTILHQPELLIFDEPFSGFDPINANMLKEQILALREQGSTIIFSTHNMSSVEEICDHITLINRSRNILSGPLEEIRHRHGENIFRIDFRGDKQSLADALDGRCRILADHVEGSIYNSVKVHIPSNDDVRTVISAVNGAVDIRSFSEIIPSMNDIFIKAVNAQ